MHKRTNKTKCVILYMCCALFIVTGLGCGKDVTTDGTGLEDEVVSSETLEEVSSEVNELKEEADGKTNETDSLESPEEIASKEDIDESEEDTIVDTTEDTVEEKHVDLILFAGQSNMSGCGGDASLAPQVSEEAGLEFRAVSDPTKLYPIVEPFGANENNLSGLYEKPGGKKGSLVSSFINEYYARTNKMVVAVSASRGETSMSQWLDSKLQDDVVARFVTARNWLKDNGYIIDHMYMVWLQGESDALKRVSQETYKTEMDNFIRPLFIEGLEKVFFITPGRTIDEKEIYSNVVNAQLTMSKESTYYALATSALSGVSTEYMTDIYHYNQHVLNMLGKFAAQSCAFYTNNNREMTTYDYKNKILFFPEDGDGQLPEDIILDLYSININESY